MAFLDTPRFPTDISYGSKIGPMWSTTKVVVQSGWDTRNKNWTYPLIIGDIAYGIKTMAQLETVISFFHVVAGTWMGWRIKDHTDYKSTTLAGTITNIDQNLGDGDGSTTAFQCRKGYTQGSVTRYRLIAKLVSGTLAVAIDGVGQTEGVDFTADYDTGIITFTTPPGSGDVVTAGFEFDVPVTFESDSLPIVLEDLEVGRASIPILETRVIT
jgi:uncharacterized protein (TIGR02217 family)